MGKNKKKKNREAKAAERGSGAQGASAQSPSAQGPTSQSPSAQGPTSQSPSAQGPTSQIPNAQGPTSQIPSAQGRTSQIASAPVGSSPLQQPVRGDDVFSLGNIGCSLPKVEQTSEKVLLQKSDDNKPMNDGNDGMRAGRRGEHGERGTHISAKDVPLSGSGRESASHSSTKQEGSLSHSRKATAERQNTPFKAKRSSEVNIPQQMVPAQSGQRRRVRRPDKGLTSRDGKEVWLRTNHFEMKIPEDETLFHYDVNFVEFAKCPKKLKRRVVNAIVKSRDGQKFFKGISPVFDGQKNLYTMKKITGDEETIKLSIDFIEDEEEKKSRKFTIKIKYAAMYTTQELCSFLTGRGTPIPSKVIQVFDIAVKQQLLLNYIQSGRSIYFNADFLSNQRDLHLAGGLSAWYGAFTSVRPGQWKLTLNVDMSTTAFVDAGPVLDYVGSVLQLTARRDEPPFHPSQGLSEQKRRAFAKEIKDLRVRVSHEGALPRKYKVCGVSPKTARTHSFDYEDPETNTKKKITVVDYYRERYRYRIRFPDFPLLQVGKKERDIFLPMEVCNIVEGQKYPRKIAEGKRAAAMVKMAALAPTYRERNITEIMKKLKLTQNEELRHLMLSVVDKPIRVKSHVLYPPNLAVGKMGTVRPRFGQWDMRNACFYDAKPLKNWGVMNFCRWVNPTEFISKLVQQASYLSMKIEQPRFVESHGNPDVAFGRGMVGKLEHVQLVLCIVSSERSKDYEKIKSYGDVQLGVPTQCIMEKNVKYVNPQVIGNVLLKVNTKIGGKTNILHEPERFLPNLKNAPVLLLGADVTHPTNRKENSESPSIAALVGNMDITLARYESAVQVQRPREETIQNLQEMVKNMLKRFNVMNGQCKPKHIIMYRDGVSEGQFDSIVVNELSAIQKACKSLDKDYAPTITFIVVQKRHHTRLFPENSNEATKIGNVLAGTVVDSGVTHPYEFDFFLNSHVAIQGTSKPAHYHVLYDDFGFSSKELINLTNCLCYMCFRCTRAISYPAPTYYAHLVAFRARHHLAAIESDTMSVASSGSGEVQIDYAALQKAITPKLEGDSCMYFN